MEDPSVRCLTMSAAPKLEHASSHSRTVNLGLDVTSNEKKLEYHESPGAPIQQATNALLDQPPVYFPSDARPSGSWTVTQDDDLEDENTRVKRRRVSPGLSQQAFEIKPNPPSALPTWHDQLQEAASASIEPTDKVSVADHCNQNREVTTSEKPRTSVRTMEVTPPLFDNSYTKVEIDLPQLPQTDGPMDNPPLQQTKPTSTPKKKDLRNGQGKLTFSAKSPRRSPRSTKVELKDDSKSPRKPRNPSKKVEVKKGKLVSSMRVALPYTAPGSAARIDGILSGRGDSGKIQPKAPSADVAPKSTHPFFMGKQLAKISKTEELKTEASSLVPTSEDEAQSTASYKAPKAWKDIGFQSAKSSKQFASSMPPIWPPISMLHVRPLEDVRASPAALQLPRKLFKAKQRGLGLNDEDLLQDFIQAMKSTSEQTLHTPTRKVMTGTQLADSVADGRQAHSFASLNARVASTSSNFDKGMAGGSQAWSQEYAPQGWQQVLGGQSKVLHDWLIKSKVHQVQNGKSQKAKPSSPKKRRKRKSEEMDEFIAASDDDEACSGGTGKNAILLVGPSGSGKTASVLAVAQQLGFEVFEIHPGMRRSARDIQDKVGDMTQNHLVQQSTLLSRESSMSIDDREAINLGHPSANQKTMANFMTKGTKGGKPKAVEANATKDSKVKSQKQSLILLEEVDILFDDDKGFWTHVQWLIKNTKRPVILTCNDIESVPVDELDLFTILHYDRPKVDVAVQNLAYIAAAEGHVVNKEALKTLYFTKGQDLRACITELNLWCQMTVGSRQGGLDWMLPYHDMQKTGSDGPVIRIVSEDTYIGGLDLLPGGFSDHEDLISFAQNSLDIPALEWVKDKICTDIPSSPMVYRLDHSLRLSEAKSAMDLFDDTAAPKLACAMSRACSLPSATGLPISSQREEVVRLHLGQLSRSDPTRRNLSSAFEPLLDESRIGLPTAPGRKATSIDNPSAISTITDVAPYIRAIVRHDQRLEQLRNDLHGSSQATDQNGMNKRQRRTRAARAALEGGDKGSTRRDKWFPEQLDWDAVLKTGGGWPAVREGEEPASRSVSAAPTPSPSTATEVEAHGVEVAL